MRVGGGIRRDGSALRLNACCTRALAQRYVLMDLPSTSTRLVRGPWIGMVGLAGHAKERGRGTFSAS